MRPTCCACGPCACGDGIPAPHSSQGEVLEDVQAERDEKAYQRDRVWPPAGAAALAVLERAALAFVRIPSVGVWKGIAPGVDGGMCRRHSGTALLDGEQYEASIGLMLLLLAGRCVGPRVGVALLQEGVLLAEAGVGGMGLGIGTYDDLTSRVTPSSTCGRGDRQSDRQRQTHTAAHHLVGKKEGASGGFWGAATHGVRMWRAHLYQPLYGVDASCGGVEELERRAIWKAKRRRTRPRNCAKSEPSTSGTTALRGAPVLPLSIE